MERGDAGDAFNGPLEDGVERKPLKGFVEEARRDAVGLMVRWGVMDFVVIGVQN